MRLRLDSEGFQGVNIDQPLAFFVDGDGQFRHGRALHGFQQHFIGDAPMLLPGFDHGAERAEIQLKPALGRKRLAERFCNDGENIFFNHWVALIIFQPLQRVNAEEIALRLL